MINEMDRKILQILLESGGPVTNQELALQCNVSINTIRKEITLINRDTQEHGFIIDSKASVGNSVEVVNPKIADPYIARLHDLFNRSERMDLRYPLRVYYLTRRCLCSDGILTLESLCQELYCSRGTLLKDLKLVKTVLGSFGLTLKSHKGKSGLAVEGSEWDIRQCLIFQHKIYRNTVELEVEDRKDDKFRAQFFMTENYDLYNQTREDFMESLAGQQDFTLSALDYPKAIHYMQLSMSRQKYSNEICYTDEQKDRALGTPEYAFAEKVCAEMSIRFERTISDNDVLGLSMILLSYETKNSHLESLPEYGELYDETQDMITYLSCMWGYERSLFDDEFVEDWICFLYTLKNRLVFGVHSDREVTGFAEHRGNFSVDFCIGFSRFYEKRHGIRLSRTDTLSAFYLFYRILRADPYCYYAQNILVTSQYGIQNAKVTAEKIRMQYGKEVNRVVPCEMCEHVGEEDEFGLLITDLESGRRQYLNIYGLPVLKMEMYPGKKGCPELDNYLNQLKEECEKTFLPEGAFRRTNLKTKDEIIRYMAEALGTDSPTCGVEEIEKNLRENDAYIELERLNGVVILPVLLEQAVLPEVVIALNHLPVVWNEQRSHVFVCYMRNHSCKDNHILNDLVWHFVRLSAQDASALLDGRRNPLEVIYPKG